MTQKRKYFDDPEFFAVDITSEQSLLIITLNYIKYNQISTKVLNLILCTAKNCKLMENNIQKKIMSSQSEPMKSNWPGDKNTHGKNR